MIPTQAHTSILGEMQRDANGVRCKTCGADGRVVMYFGSGGSYCSGWACWKCDPSGERERKGLKRFLEGEPWWARLFGLFRSAQ